MKNFKLISLVVAAFFLSSLAGCASTPTQSSTGQFVDDSVITTKVKAKLFDYLALKGFEIKVETFKGVVQLSGFVSSQVNIDRATDVASHVAGVVSVHNNMQLK